MTSRGTSHLEFSMCPGDLSFSLTAILKLLEDLATDLPVLIADVESVFASTPSGPTPAPTPSTH